MIDLKVMAQMTFEQPIYAFFNSLSIRLQSYADCTSSLPTRLTREVMSVLSP